MTFSVFVVGMTAGLTLLRQSQSEAGLAAILPQCELQFAGMRLFCPARKSSEEK
jgi:hypothetical protein